ncbi:hypothetical protein ACFX1X_020541 [Malus domestica]
MFIALEWSHSHGEASQRYVLIILISAFFVLVVFVICITNPSNADCGCSRPMQSPPTHQEAGEVLSLVRIAFSCLHPNPQSRPTMKQVSQLLSTKKLHLSKPLHMITCNELLTLDPLTG